MTNGFSEDRRPLYRSRHGYILGVCRGLAEYWNLSVFWTRVLAVVMMPITGFWPVVGLYILTALVMKPEPVVPIETEEEGEFYNSFASSRSMAIHRLKRTFDNLDRRIQRIEDIVTSREYDWNRRMNG
jgi:phage shock protein C